MALGSKQLAPSELDTFEDQRLVEELRKAKEIAVHEMCEFASDLGGNAVVGVDLDFESIQMGAGGGMLMVSASGTAVVIES